MKWYECSMLKKGFLETTDWNAAWKKRGEEAYKLIPNPRGYWLADTLLFENEQGTYLFVEAYDKHLHRGVIGVLPYNGSCFSDFRIVISQKYHMSYPYVFTWKGCTYMIPETSENNSIELYRAVNFPDRWERVGELLSGCYVDTTVWPSIGGTTDFVGFTYDLVNKKLVRFELDMDCAVMCLVGGDCDMENNMRPGGRPYFQNNSLYFPLQNNKYLYGQSLRLVNERGDDSEVFLTPQGIATEEGLTFRRLHTYSRSTEFEAVDLSDFRFSVFKALRKVLGK